MHAPPTGKSLLSYISSSLVRVTCTVITHNNIGKVSCVTEHRFHGVNLNILVIHIENIQLVTYDIIHTILCTMVI